MKMKKEKNHQSIINKICYTTGPTPPPTKSCSVAVAVIDDRDLDNLKRIPRENLFSVLPLILLNVYNLLRLLRKEQNKQIFNSTFGMFGRYTPSAAIALLMLCDILNSCYLVIKNFETYLKLDIA
uniref:Uncharacterized protein n=1 Tax=Glossina brevipalpis TaxID=37001 RepID=A0A1A9WVS6_9MUSC